MIKFKTGYSLLLLAGWISVISCKTQPLPSITSAPTNAYTPGRVVWHDLITPDLNTARLFYAAVFGWKFDEVLGDKGSFSLATLNGKPIAMVTELPKTKHGSAEWVGSISVTTIADVISAAKANGARILKDPVFLKGRGATAFISDPGGANIGFIHAEGGDPVPEKARENEFLGLELWSDNPGNAAMFYNKVLGYLIENTKVGNIPYIVLKNEERNCAGILKTPVQGVRSHWVPYIKVANASAVIEKARNAGAKILLEPTKDVREGTVGLFLDPSGAPVAVQEYNQ